MAQTAKFIGTKLKGRYELVEVIGQGGMGIVYRALDLEMQSEVALKTIQEAHDPVQLELFRKECAVLRKLRHPNVIDLYDYGVLEDNGVSKPFFVMPLLPGLSLDSLIKNQATRLTVERVTDIITQTCRGLHATHELGIVHRDIKPSNILVLEDDSVKLIDFGVVHLIDQRSRSGLKGTLQYMSPEQIELNSPTAASDVFSLAVVCYEALTRRRPFIGNTTEEVAQAILGVVPVVVSDLNPSVGLTLSQVIQAAMAKKPWQRTSSARQFGEELQKALHSQPIERFNPERIEPRIRRAQRALEDSEYEFAAEILSELEAEGHIHAELRSLRRQVNQALREKTLVQLLDGARRRVSEEEFPLALQKVEEILRLEPSNADALSLKSEIEGKYRTQQIDNWFRLAQEHINIYAFSHARQALENVLRLRPTDTGAIHKLAEVDRREAAYRREKQEKDALYKQALDCWHRGDVSAALTKLERVLDLDRRAPDLSGSAGGLSYESLYSQVRSEHEGIKNSYAEARKLLAENDFTGASAISERVLDKYPGHALFEALKFDIVEQQRQHVSYYIVKTDREVEAEPDLDRKVAILSEAARIYPEETHFKERLDGVAKKRDLVASIARRVGNLEERGEYAEALGQLDILRSIYPQYPAIDLEIDRIRRRREQQAISEAKARWVDQIDRALSMRDFEHALDLLKLALADFPGDAELSAQERLARDGFERGLEASKLSEQAQILCDQGQMEAGLDRLWQAHRLDDHSPVIRVVLVETILKYASSRLETDSNIAEELIRQAQELDPGNAQAKSLQQVLSDRNKQKIVDSILSKSREMQAAGMVSEALAELENGLTAYPEEPRLIARRDALLNIHREAAGSPEPVRNLAVEDTNRRVRQSDYLPAQNSIADQSSGEHQSTPDIDAILRELEQLKSTAHADDNDTPTEESEGKRLRLSSLTDVEGAEPLEGGKDGIELEGETVEVSESSHSAPVQEGFGASTADLRKRYALLGLILLLASIGIGVFVFRRNPRPLPPTPPLEVAISVQTSVPGASIFVNDKSQGVAPQRITLGEGEYKIDASLPGYRSVEPVPLRVARGLVVPSTIDVRLEPLPLVLRLVAPDFNQAKLNDQTLTLQGPEQDVPDLSPGTYKLTLSSPQSAPIMLEFRSDSGQLPAVLNVSSKDVGVIVFSTLGERGLFYAAGPSNTLPRKISVGNSTIQDPIGQGQPLQGFVQGANTILLENTTDIRSEIIEVDASPGISVLVGENNAGILNVTSDVEGATVAVMPADKKAGEQRKPITKGSASFRLEPKQYTVKVSAAGYPDLVERATVTKGKKSDLPLSLERLISKLQIKGGTPDAEIFLDGVSRGRLSSAGDLAATAVSAGNHEIRIEKADYEPKETRQNFTAGDVVSLTGQEARLTLLGGFQFNITPENSQIQYRLSTEQTSHNATNRSQLKLRAGHYIVSAGAQGFQTRQEALEVRSGEPTQVSWTLAREEVTSASPPPSSVSPQPPSSPRIELEGFKFPPRREGEWNKFTKFDPFQQRQPGTYSFRIKLDRAFLGTAPKRARWFLNCQSERDYIEYQIDEEKITRLVVSSGKKAAEKTPGFRRETHALGKGDAYQLEVNVSENQVTIRGSGAVLVMTDTLPGTNFLQGDFCFPDGQAVSHFQFAAATRR